MNRVAIFVGVLAVPMLAAATAHAHHSYALFDGTRRVLLEGTVARLDWQNPHVFLWVYVPQESGGPVLYGLESDSVNALVRRGWSKTSLEPGDEVTLEFFALVDGRPGGHLVRAIRADGRELTGQPGPVGAISSGAAAGPAPQTPARVE
jgi:hypothetical protein